MAETYYTHALWRVKPGNEEAFIEAWKELGKAFGQLSSTPGNGTLIRSLTDPTLFYSFGPWDSLEDIEAMRRDAQAQQAIQRIIELCNEAAPGAYHVVAEVQL
ncbi:MAG TPA: antibiotic biosynthesis monooxygenase family protein [Chloroflexia bacterium]|nr:antibiotic biosynthesis monooxygenase family protein [Chloroflexia bacterium]